MNEMKVHTGISWFGTAAVIISAFGMLFGCGTTTKTKPVEVTESVKARTFPDPARFSEILTPYDQNWTNEEYVSKLTSRNPKYIEDNKDSMTAAVGRGEYSIQQFWQDIEKDNFIFGLYYQILLDRPGRTKQMCESISDEFTRDILSKEWGNLQSAAASTGAPSTGNFPC